MRILILTPNFPPEYGGPASYCWELLQRFPPKIDVKVFSFSNLTKDAPVDVTLVSTDGSMLLRQFRLLLACLRQGQNCDIFYCQEPAVVGFVGMVAAKILGKKIVVKFFGDPVWEEKMRKRQTQLPLPEFMAKGEQWKDWRSYLTRIVIKLSNKVIVPSAYLIDILSEYYSLPKDKTIIIYNSTDIATGVNQKTENYTWKKNLLQLKSLFKSL